MSLVKLSNIQVGQDVTATNNFTLNAPANGTLTIGVGNSGSQTTILTIASGGTLSLTGNATLGSTTANSHTINGSLSITQNLTVSVLSTTPKVLASTASTAASTAVQLVSAGNGIFAPLTNSLGFSTAGTEALRIDSTNNFSRAIPGGTILYPDFASRTWVNFNGTGTVAIRGSGNVSSITDNGVGDYTINFTTGLPDTNYAPVFGTDQAVLGGFAFGANIRNGGQLTTSLRINTWDANSLDDLATICVSIFR